MVLEPQKPSAYNEMLGRISKAAPSPTKQRQSNPERPSKRLKLSKPGKEVDDAERSEPEWAPSSPRAVRREVPDSDAESGDEEIDDGIPSTQPTDIEQSLPPIKTDKEAIEAYESLRAAESALSSEPRERLGQRKWVKGKSSIYVDAFNLALETVLEDESHLFDEAEMRVFEEWRLLGYEAQYLYVRLFLRKTSAWFRVNRLGYYGDIADLNAAASELYNSRDLPESTNETQITPGELKAPIGTVLGESFTFADTSEEHITTLEEASSLLLLDELKAIAKEAKVQGKNKTDLLKALRRTSGKQTALGFASLQRTDTEESVQSNASEAGDESPGTNRDAHFLRKILAETGPCIRISLAPFKLFERVHLVFYRSTQWTEKSLTTIILARIARRNFPEYIVSRSSNIFPSRSLLLEFEASIRTQFRVDNVLEFGGPPTRETLENVLEIFEDVLPRWRILLRDEQRKEDTAYASGEGAYLRRLSPAWVYTRIVHKGAYVLGLGKFKQHAREHATLTELLAQRLFHASRRGAWYQRKALLEEHYMAALNPAGTRTPEEQKRHWRRAALRTCEEGLQDNLVHVIYHYDLQKRVAKLERSLKIAKRLQHDFGHTRLAKPFERFVHGVRIERPPKLARTTSSSALPTATCRQSSAAAPRRGAKTIWLDPAEADGECSVEAMCLSWYRGQGWKGYHSEGGILRTLFALLFYDVLFAYVPNVFQTPYQTCPLDLHTDAFFGARMSEVNGRCVDIANGGGEGIVREVWRREGERRTCVVGLDWGFELEDVCEVVRCFGGEALGVVCKVMAQEYAERGGGVPDLFLWRTSGEEGVEGEKMGGEVCFAEVKSENDRLSDTQRRWIHVLTGAGIRVELCNAVASEVRVLD